MSANCIADIADVRAVGLRGRLDCAVLRSAFSETPQNRLV